KQTPKWIRGFGHAYPICCHSAMHSLGRKLEQMGLHDDVNYVFEAGHKFQAEAMYFMSTWVLVPEMRNAYRYKGHAFLDKADAVPLQAADMLAWEWAKCRDETLEKGNRPLRKSSRALFENNLKHYSIHHISGTTLTKYLNHVKKLGLEQ